MKRLRLILGLIGIGAIGLLIFAFVIFPARWKATTKRQSIDLLKQAKTTNELQAAVGSYGLFIALTNDQWIAIRYRDTHSFGIKSVSIALDSGGAWFESEAHHCGTFRSWANYKKMLAEDDSEAKEDLPAIYQTLLAIESAPNLETARARLRDLGMNPLQK